MEPTKLTQYSRGSGCGCKISPKVLEEILKTNTVFAGNKKLLVGNETKDDAAVYDMGNGIGFISTVDFFTPIVDDAIDFGKIAAANAISDVYAMGGTPILALAILGWPVDKLSTELAQKVIEGARIICKEARIPLAGGHSIDSPEPIFGLTVNGFVELKNLKKNSTAKEGDLLYLTKPLGTGILAAAEKKCLLKAEHKYLALEQMTQLNKVGAKLAQLSGVNAMTDITGFGLLGHLIEMAESSNLQAEINYSKIPLITDLSFYTSQMCVPDNTFRNWNSFEKKTEGITGDSLFTLCDPQTNGGILIAVDPKEKLQVENVLKAENLEKFTSPIGVMKRKKWEQFVVLK